MTSLPYHIIEAWVVDRNDNPLLQHHYIKLQFFSGPLYHTTCTFNIVNFEFDAPVRDKKNPQMTLDKETVRALRTFIAPRVKSWMRKQMEKLKYKQMGKLKHMKTQRKARTTSTEKRKKKKKKKKKMKTNIDVRRIKAAINAKKRPVVDILADDVFVPTLMMLVLTTYRTPDDAIAACRQALNAAFETVHVHVDLMTPVTVPFTSVQKETDDTSATEVEVEKDEESEDVDIGDAGDHVLVRSRRAAAAREEDDDRLHELHNRLTDMVKHNAKKYTGDHHEYIQQTYADMLHIFREENIVNEPEVSIAIEEMLDHVEPTESYTDRDHKDLTEDMYRELTNRIPIDRSNEKEKKNKKKKKKKKKKRMSNNELVAYVLDDMSNAIMHYRDIYDDFEMYKEATIASFIDILRLNYAVIISNSQIGLKIAELYHVVGRTPPKKHTTALNHILAELAAARASI